MDQAEAMLGRVERLPDAAAVTAPLTERRTDRVAAAAARAGAGREKVFGGRLPESRGPLTLAQSVNAALHDALLTWPQAQVFGEDVARKGGVYGATRGLRKAFGANRVFDTLLDEQTILGVALGGALAGTLPIPEIQYLAYLHNAEDQLRGEAASLRFFSDGQYGNGMVVRIAGLAYQKGFGGHFHNDNSVAVLRDIPGLALAVASHPATAPALLRQCLALAEQEKRVCVFLEPIALYHTRDLHTDGDGGWLARYAPPDGWADAEIAARTGPDRTRRRRPGARHVRQRRADEPAGGRDAGRGAGRRHPRRGPAVARAAAGREHARRPRRRTPGAGGRRDPGRRRRLRGGGGRPGRRRLPGADLPRQQRRQLRPAGPGGRPRPAR